VIVIRGRCLSDGGEVVEVGIAARLVLDLAYLTLKNNVMSEL